MAAISEKTHFGGLLISRATLLRTLAIIAEVVMSCFVPNIARAQIFVTEPKAGTIAEYDLATGAAINTALVHDLGTIVDHVSPTSIVAAGDSLLFQTTDSISSHSNVIKYNLSNSSLTGIVSFPADAGGQIATSGSGVYVRNGSGYTEYDINTGSILKTVSAQTTLSPILAASQDYLFIGSPSSYTIVSGTTYIGEISGYNTSSGSAVSTFGLVGIGAVSAMVVSGSDLFIAGIITPAGSASSVAGVAGVAEYDALTGQLLNASFISGLSNPVALAVLGNSLYVMDSGSGTIGEYNLTTGQAINTALVTGLTDASSFTVVPEPNCAVLCALGIAALLAGVRKLRRTQNTLPA